MKTTHHRLHLVGFGLLLIGASACTHHVGEDGSGDPQDQRHFVSDPSNGDPGDDVDCSYDREAWAAITREDISCTRNSDCCYFVENCEAIYVIVHADDFALAREVAPCFNRQDGICASCAAPIVEPVCLEGKCVGQLLEPDGDGQWGYSHCATDEVVMEVTVPQQAFSCR